MRHVLVLLIALIIGCSSSNLIVKGGTLTIKETDTPAEVLLKLQYRYPNIDVYENKFVEKIERDVEESSKGEFILRRPTEEEIKTFIIFRCPCQYFYLYDKDKFNEHLKLTVHDRSSFETQDPEAVLKSIKR